MGVFMWSLQHYFSMVKFLEDWLGMQTCEGEFHFFLEE